MIGKKFRLDQLERRGNKFLYKGHLWTPNMPIKSTRKNKKMMVMATKMVRGIRYGKIIHFGECGYGHNYSKQAKVNFLKRTAYIRDKYGRLTKNDRWSANYWSRKVLWPKDKPCNGPKITRRAA
ncbi:MAG: hypothetical protein KDK56_03950 [Simkania sp.]|nr:hypothetical protein [Simkania sp.]MCB1075895.1 hypothetical protein [Simkania sp.]MCP5490586.1 hypothetical protein [Chlamydiales bacterium]